MWFQQDTGNCIFRIQILKDIFNDGVFFFQETVMLNQNLESLEKQSTNSVWARGWNYSCNWWDRPTFLPKFHWTC